MLASSSTVIGSLVMKSPTRMGGPLLNCGDSCSVYVQNPMAATASERVRFRFIQSRSADLIWYIGSSLAGWLYVLLVLVLGRGLSDPIREPFARLPLFGASLP